MKGELIFEIKTKETGNVLAFEDKKMVFWMYSLELNITPENTENVTIFTQSLSLKAFKIGNDLKKFGEELSSFNNVMEQAYDLFKQESFIRNTINEIYNSVFPPFIEIEEICGYIGMIGVSLNDESLSESILKSSK